MKFNMLGLSRPILEAVTAKGYETPSPIQAKAIPAILEGKDVMAAAQTGTGKTAGFVLPILETLIKGRPALSNQVRALIVTPTRELAAQIGDSISDYGVNLSISSTVVFGGVKINPQMKNLRRGVDILVATPGRLLDLYSQNAVRFDDLEILVLDEADRMLDMGFIRDIRKIIALLPNKRQNLMFSATFSDQIRNLAKGLINNPVEISVGERNSTLETIDHWIHPVDKSKKTKLLTHLILENNWQRVLVFSRTKHGANRLTRNLESSGIKAMAIHGNKSQGARTKALSAFKDGSIRILVATDIAARGIDISLLQQVVNFDLPNVPEDYIHRIGRTGRAGESGQAVSLVSSDEFDQLKDIAGESGQAVSLVSSDEFDQLKDIERLLKKAIVRKEIKAFNSTSSLPESISKIQTARSKKPKKPKDNDKINRRRWARSNKTTSQSGRFKEKM